MTDPNSVLNGIPKFVELEIAKVLKPALDRIDALEQRLALLEGNPPKKRRPPAFSSTAV